MNYTELQEAIQQFDIDSVRLGRKDLNKLRNEFVLRFPAHKIIDMQIDDYIVGKQSQDSFCYWLERRLGQLGLMIGSTSLKFGVYFHNNREYRFSNKFGDNYQDAFRDIKSEISMLLEAGRNYDLRAIVQNKISPMFKGKILSTYYPDRYLSVFSNEHIDFFLKLFNLDTAELLKKDAVYKREALVAFKNQDKEMQKWSVGEFEAFLYDRFSPKNKHLQSQIKDFKAIDRYSYVCHDLDFSESTQDSVSKNHPPRKRDYVEDAKKHKRYGDRGEAIVMQAERDRLEKKLGCSKSEAKCLVIQKSLEDDSCGYDIESLNNDKSTRYIEVKATTEKEGSIDFYYTQNEYEKAQEFGESYYIYIVFEITSSEPKIWVLHNPFISNNKIIMKPIQYKVSLKTK